MRILCKRFTKGESSMSTITIKDIARMAGVSCATVSRVLNGTLTVRPENQERILELCRQHGYRRNLLARSLSAGKTGLIGCILSDLNHPLFSRMALALELYARQKGYHVLVCHGKAEDDDIETLFEFLIGHRVDGVIFISSSRRATELSRRYGRQVPVVLQGNASGPAEECGISSVSVDSFTGGRMAAEYLAGLGHRSAVYLGLRRESYSHSVRFQGFLEGARRCGMAVRDLPNETEVSTIEVGYRLGRQFFFSPHQETAVFASCDVLALGVMAAAKELYISIPGEVSLMGFDNISYAGLPNIRLTTIDHQADQVIKAAMDRLLAQMTGSVPPQAIVLPPVLVKRASCAPPDGGAVLP